MLSVLEILLPLVAIALIMVPMYLFVQSGANVKRKLLIQTSIFTGVFLLVFAFQLNGLTTLAAEEVTAVAATGINQGIGFMAAALSTGLGAVAAGIAVAAAAPAAIGAISEDSSNFGKAIIFVALGEGIAIYGLLISILIMNKL